MEKILGAAFLILTANCAAAQNTQMRQNLIWHGVFTTMDINTKWYLQNEFQERHFVNPAAQHQFLVRCHIHRSFAKSGWESSLGMGLFFQSPNDPDANTKLTIPELRPHIELAYRHKFRSLIFDHRYRGEFRFFHHTNSTETELSDGFGYGNLRFRYRLQTTIPLFRLKEKRYAKLKVSDELHLNVGNRNGKEVFDQNRIYGGISCDILPTFIVEAGYMKLFQQSSVDNYFNRNILRFTIFHKLNLSQGKD